MIDRMGQLTANAPGECQKCGMGYPTAAVRCARCSAPVGTADMPAGTFVLRNDTYVTEREATMLDELADLTERVERLESEQRHAAARGSR